ncbi:MAG: hypothetical protein Q9170_002265 [Blastenia crenularia]
MLLIFHYAFITLALATASPLQQSSHSLGRSPSTHDSSVDRATNVIRREEVSAASTSSSGILGTLPEPTTAINFDRPFGNNALWQEALAFDKAAGVEKENRMFYAIIANFQVAENSARNSLAGISLTSSMISQGLEALNIYPMQFNQPQANDPETLVQLSSTPQQTIQSFGASGAWWPFFLKDFPPAQQKNLSSILFSEDGLHLSGYRYNIGASQDSGFSVVTTPGRAVESFMLSDGTYDWSRDGPGEYYLQAASDANVSSITAFANSAPSALTANKKPCGNELDPTIITQFTTYITEVLSHFAQKGIVIDYISPMNEPDDDFDACAQEGMSVDKSNRAAVFQSLRTALQASNSSTVRDIKIMGDEISQVASQALPEYNTWLPPTLTSKTVDAIAVHMYDWPDDATLLNYRQLLINISLPSPPPPIKMTEISTFRSASGVHAPWGWTGPHVMGVEYDPGINSALDMARFIWQWLTLVNSESWDWWTAVSNYMPGSPSTCPGCEGFNATSGFNDGLVYIDPFFHDTKDYNFYLTKRFWVFKHFTKFLRPGAVRFDIPNEILPYGTVAVAARNVDGVYTSIFVNRNATEQAIRMKVGGNGVAGGVIKGIVQTTDKDDFADVALPVVGADGVFKITLPAKGVMSIQFTVKDEGGSPAAGKRDVDIDDLSGAKIERRKGPRYRRWEDRTRMME